MTCIEATLPVAQSVSRRRASAPLPCLRSARNGLWAFEEGIRRKEDWAKIGYPRASQLLKEEDF